jgi:hypothetical protein
MSRAVKLGAIALALIAVAVLLYTAASGSIFFVNQELTPDTVVYEEEDGYAFYFYKDGGASDEKAVKMATIFHSVGVGDGNLAPVLFQVIPRDGYEIDSLHLELDMLQPASALLLEDPGFGYERTDYDSTVVLNFPELDSQPSETVTLNFQLDLAAIEPTIPEQLLLDIDLTMHEGSILKIVRYNASVTIQLEVPSIA